MNITAPIRRFARLTPDAPAIIAADGSMLTYAAFDRRIDRMAARAGSLGLQPGDAAGLAITGPDESLALTLALALARLGIASADPSVPAEHMRLRFKPGASEGAEDIGFNAAWLTEPPGGDVPVEIYPDDAAICRICASSGTSGVAKHLAVSHALLTRRIFGYWLALGSRPETRIVGVNFGIPWGLCLVLRTFWAGGTLVLTNPQEALAAIRRHRVTAIGISPVALRALIDALPPDAVPLPSLRSVEVSGARLPAPLQALAAARLSPNLMSFYGASETGGVASAPFAALSGRDGAIGLVHADVEAQIVDAQHDPLPPGMTGLLRLRSDQTIAGYIGTDGGSFRDGWFYPGDLATLWPDGMLCLAGRATEIINSGGVKISPSVIEDALLTLPTITDAAAFGVPDALGVEQIWAAIVATTPVANAVLTALCQDRLPGRAPKFILQMKALPRNANGKVQRDALIAFARQQGGGFRA